MSPVILSIVALLVAIFSIQSGVSLAKQLFPLIGPDGATALRLLFASIMLLTFWRPWRVKLDRRQTLRIIAYGLALGGMNLTFYYAVVRLPLGLTVALEFTGPLTVAFFSSRKPLDFLWATLAVIGILLILPLAPSEAPIDLVGVILALVAGACWGLYIVFGKKAGEGVQSGIATSYGMLAACILVFPVGALHAGASLFSQEVLPMALAVAFLSSALPYSLEMFALKRLPTPTFGILMSLEPAVAALSGLVFLGEHLSLSQWLAILCIMLASFGSAIGSATPAKT